jgi:hypothetical protein
VWRQTLCAWIKYDDEEVQKLSKQEALEMINEKSVLLLYSITA